MYQTVWKVSLQYVKFPESLEGFQTVWKVSGESGKFLKSPESFRTVWKVSRQCQKFPPFFHDKHGILAKAIYAHLCRKSYLRSFGAFLSQKRFTRSVQKVFAHDILPTGKFWLTLHNISILISILLICALYIFTPDRKQQSHFSAHFDIMAFYRAQSKCNRFWEQVNQSISSYAAYKVWKSKKQKYFKV